MSKAPRKGRIKCKGTCDGDGPVRDVVGLLHCVDCYPGALKVKPGKPPLTQDRVRTVKPEVKR